MSLNDRTSHRVPKSELAGWSLDGERAVGTGQTIDLSRYTYMIRHNPNCPSPFEVRTGGGAFMVDAKEPRNFISYGKTLNEAMTNAAIKIEDHERCKMLRRVEEQFNNIVWA